MLMNIQNNLLEWFFKNKRDLPWRTNRTPYRVWIAEIMLQQTQVKTVIPYYHKWMDCYSSIKDVSFAEEVDLLKKWEGLGYYTRVRNIYKTSSIIVKKYNGIFPNSEKEILELPGIGKYTAGAILSLAFNQKYPVVDGNVKRVLSRIFAIQESITSSKTIEQLWKIADQLLPEKKSKFTAGNMNEALMELGATICLSGIPHCSICPVKKFCEGYKLSIASLLPVGIKHPKIQNKYVTMIIARNSSDKYWIIQHKERLFGCLWEFPSCEHINITQQKNWLKGINNEFKTQSIGSFIHYYTRYKVYVNVLKIQTMIKKTAEITKLMTSINVEIKMLPISIIEKKPLSVAGKKTLELCLKNIKKEM